MNRLFKRVMAALGGIVLLASASAVIVPQFAAAQTPDSNCRNVNQFCAVQAFGEVYASAARTAAPTATAYDIGGYTGLRCITDVTTNGAAVSLTTAIQAQDDVTGTWVTIASKASENGTTQYILTVGPGVYDETGVRVGTYMPKTYRVQMTHGTSSSVTYGVDCARLP